MRGRYGSAYIFEAGMCAGMERAANLCDITAAQWEHTEQAMSIAAETLAIAIREAAK
jgi:hypothetical protein